MGYQQETELFNRPRTVKELAPDDQPRERALKYGCGVLSVPDLWAIILRTGTPGNPITDLCRELMQRNDGRLHRLERRTRKELSALKGIGDTKSIQIEAVMELIRRYVAEEPVREEPISSSKHIFERMRYKIGNLPHEEIWLLLLNRRNIVVKELCLSTGTSTASIFDSRIAIKHAILENAESIIMVHNHPSGGILPSICDDKITAELKQACNFMKIRLLDHVIVTADNFFSYNDQEKL